MSIIRITDPEFDEGVNTPPQKKKKKKWGIEIKYSWSQFVSYNWYASQKARDMAFDNLIKQEDNYCLAFPGKRISWARREYRKVER